MKRGSAALFLAGLALTWISSKAQASFPGAQAQATGRTESVPISGRFHHRVLLKLPAGYDPAKTYPLIVALHGNGGDIAGFSIAFSGFREQPVLIALPEGEYDVEGAGHSWFLRTADRSLWEAADEASMDRVFEAIEVVAARYPVGKIYVFGFSEGTSLAYMVGLRHPERIAGIAAVSGYLPEIDQPGSILHEENLDRAKGVRVFVGRGVDDHLVKRERYLHQVEFLRGKGFDVATCEFPGGHTLTGTLMSRMWEWLTSGR